MARIAGIYTTQAQQLSELQIDLSTTWESMTENTRRMLSISIQIDWPNSELAIRPKSSRSANSEVLSPVLLPPTPSMLEDIRKLKAENCQQGITSNIQLLSPAPQTPHFSGNVSTGVGSALTRTPISTGQVTRRFPRRINTEQSPLLKQSLIQSTLQRTAGEIEDNSQPQGTNEQVSSEENEKESSRASLNVFSPVLGLTKSPEESYARPPIIIQVDSNAASSFSSTSAGLSSRVSKEDFSLGSRPGSSLGLFDDSKPPSHEDFGSRPSSSLGLRIGSNYLGLFGLDQRPSSALGLNVGNGASPTFGSLRAAADVSFSEDNTQFKLEMYRKILESTKNKSQKTEEKPRPTLQSVWNSHRQSLSPRVKPKSNVTNGSQCSPSMHFSPSIDYRTPGMDSKKMESRLDQLMTTLTFSDDSLDLDFGRISLGGDEFLSPHCP